MLEIILFVFGSIAAKP